MSCVLLCVHGGVKLLETVPLIESHGLRCQLRCRLLEASLESGGGALGGGGDANIHIMNA